MQICLSPKKMHKKHMHFSADFLKESKKCCRNGVEQNRDWKNKKQRETK